MKTNIKIALVLCPSWGIETPHLGIALLIANLRRQGFQVEAFDFNIRVHLKHIEKGLWKSEEDVHWEDERFIYQFIKNNETLLNSFVEEVISSDSQVIGFSIYNTTKRLSLELARRIKHKDKNKIIVLGGQQTLPKGAAESLIKDGAVDAVVMGEGDEVLPELVGKMERAGKIDCCSGVIYKDNGKVIDCGMRYPIMDLNSLPFPDFSDFSLQKYSNPFQLPILSSRGCPYQCVFCSTKFFWIRYRSMNGVRIFQEMAHQLNMYKGVHFFTFNDHVINVNMKTLSRLCDLVLEAKSKKTGGIDWGRLSHANLIGPFPARVVESTPSHLLLLP